MHLPSSATRAPSRCRALSGAAIGASVGAALAKRGFSTATSVGAALGAGCLTIGSGYGVHKEGLSQTLSLATVFIDSFERVGAGLGGTQS